MDVKDAAFVKEIQRKLDEKIRQNEISVLEYWKDRLYKLVVMRPDGIASLQIELSKLAGMMENRINTLKRQKD